MSDQGEQQTTPSKSNTDPASAERYVELQKLVMYADPLHMGRFSVWLIAHYTLLAVVAAAFSTLPANLIGVLATVGIVVSVLWLMTARNLSTRIDWLNVELCKYDKSVHAEYLKCVPKRWHQLSTTIIMTWILPSLLAAAWVMIFVFKVW